MFEGMSSAEITDSLGPEILSDYGARAPTRCVGSVKIEVPAAASEVLVTLYESTDYEDRGGVIVRLEVGEGGSQLLPVVKTLSQNVVELHVAGDGESKAFLTALMMLLNMRRKNRGVIGTVVAIEKAE